VRTPGRVLPTAGVAQAAKALGAMAQGKNSKPDAPSAGNAHAH
jgi:hypothetical protein